MIIKKTVLTLPKNFRVRFYIKFYKSTKTKENVKKYIYNVSLKKYTFDKQTNQYLEVFTPEGQKEYYNIFLFTDRQINLKAEHVEFRNMSFDLKESHVEDKVFYSFKDNSIVNYFETIQEDVVGIKKETQEQKEQDEVLEQIANEEDEEPYEQGDWSTNDVK